MANQINIQPPTLDLMLYAGDGVEFRLICTDNDDAPVPMDGEVEAQIRVDRDVATPVLATFDAEIVDPTNGIVQLSLTGDQTQEVYADPSSKNGKFLGVWDVQWTPAGMQPRTLCQGRVECVVDVTR